MLFSSVLVNDGESLSRYLQQPDDIYDLIRLIKTDQESPDAGHALENRESQSHHVSLGALVALAHRV